MSWIKILHLYIMLVGAIARRCGFENCSSEPFSTYLMDGETAWCPFLKRSSRLSYQPQRAVEAKKLKWLGITDHPKNCMYYRFWTQPGSANKEGSQVAFGCIFGAMNVSKTKRTSNAALFVLMMQNAWMGGPLYTVQPWAHYRQPKKVASRKRLDVVL
jgi:hypothetical protein